ncbi:hypothetical protein Q7P37_002852 [Cladosporium fusiforme]
MASFTTAPPSSTSYANTTTSAPFTGCGPCTVLSLNLPGVATWGAPNASVPAIRTTHLLFDPNANTTSTSVQCNSAALSAWPTTEWFPLYGLDDECNLVASFSAYGEHTATVTLTSSAGLYVDLNSKLGVQGEISTTDSNGSPTCMSDWYTTFESPIGIYTHSVTILENDNWLLPDLSSYLPGVAAVEQCTNIGPGGAPIALTPARDIILPVSTLPLATSTSDTPEPTTTARPGSSTATALPATKDESREDAVVPTSTRGDTGSDIKRPSQAGPTTTTSREDDSADPTPRPQEPEDQPIQPASSSTSRQQSIDIVPVRPSPSANDEQESIIDIQPVRPSQSSSGGDQPIQIVPVQPKQTSPPQSSSGSDQPIQIVPVQPEQTNAPQPSSGGEQPIQIVPVQPVQPEQTDSQQPNDNAEPSQVSNVPGVGAINPIGEDANTYVVGDETTLSAGGPAATISGTVYTAQPSGSGIFATPAEQADPFASYIAIGVSGQDNSAGNEGSREDAYVIGDNGATIAAGQEAAAISGTTFSALPSSAGIAIIANGQTTTLDREGLAESQPTPTSDAYILNGGSETISLGGSAAVISGTTYTALPSNAGIAIIANDQTITLDREALSESQPAPTSDAYILNGGSATISAGGSAAVISGTTYTALPSNAGIEVLAHGSSTTLSGGQLTGLAGQTTQEPLSTDAYVIRGTHTLSVGGGAWYLSGTRYEALPSGEGVRVIADGKTETRNMGNVTAAVTTTMGGNGTTRASSSSSSSSETGNPSGNGNGANDEDNANDDDNDDEAAESSTGQAALLPLPAGVWTAVVGFIAVALFTI